MLSFPKLGVNFKNLPLFFQVLGISCSLMIIVAGYALVSDLFREARIFLYTGLTGFLILSLVVLATSNRNLKETGLSQLFSLVFSFLVLPLFLAVPGWIILPNVNFTDIYLDMVSAFTTTGLPVFEIEFLSKPIHLWRALIAWFGGGLIWIAAFVILLPANLGGFEVFSNKQEALNSNRKLTLDERSITLVKVSQKLVPLYSVLTIILWGLLTILGTDGYTSLIRALSVVSTSGISGPSKFDSDEAGLLGEIVILLFLFLAVSHHIINFIYQRIKFNRIITDTEIRLGLLIVFIVTVLISFKQLSQTNISSNSIDSLAGILKLIWGNFFTAFSFMTTNGYVSSFWKGSISSDEVTHISLILIGLCLFGGGVATTAGGIKLLRISILFSAFSNETGKLLHPSSVVNNNKFTKSLDISVYMAWVFFMLFIVSLATLTIILSMFGILFEDSLLLVVSCLTTTGPLLQIVGLENYSIIELSLSSKIILILTMILGRLEILVALSLITFGIWKN